jgi:hypothetical protein
MNEEATKMKTAGRRPGKGPIAIMVILGLAVIGLLIWLLVMYSDYKDLKSEKEAQRTELQAELDSLMYEHDMIKQEYGTMADSLSVKDSIIQANAEEIRKLLDTQWEYYKIKKKLALLQNVSQGYVRQMDSLYVVNQALTEENIEIREDLQEARRDYEEMNRDREMLNEKVETASILQVYRLDAYGIRARRDNEKETDKARRVDKIKVCFTLAENKIVEPGTKEIFVRIARPDKLILTKDRSDTYTFMYQGEKLQYSIKKLIDYQNSSMDMCLYWEKSYAQKEMMEGTYHVEVFHDDEVIGHTQFVLR